MLKRRRTDGCSLLFILFYIISLSPEMVVREPEMVVRATEMVVRAPEESEAVQ